MAEELFFPAVYATQEVPGSFNGISQTKGVNPTSWQTFLKSGNRERVSKLGVCTSDDIHHNKRLKKNVTYSSFKQYNQTLTKTSTSTEQPVHQKVRPWMINNDEEVSKRLTFNGKCGAAADTASIVLSFTGVNSLIIKAGREQFQDCYWVNKWGLVVAPIRDLDVLFVPSHFQRGSATDSALQSERLILLHKLNGREFQHKLRWFWKAKIEIY